MYAIDNRPTGKASQMLILACPSGHSGEIRISLRLWVVN